MSEITTEAGKRPTALERRAFKIAEMHRAHWCGRCTGEAVAAERARLRALVDRELELGFMGSDEDTDRTVQNIRDHFLALLEAPDEVSKPRSRAAVLLAIQGRLSVPELWEKGE